MFNAAEYPAGTVVHAVQEQGGTFVFVDKAKADEFYEGEKGAVNLCRGTYTLLNDHDGLDSAADEAAMNFGPGLVGHAETHRLVGYSTDDRFIQECVLSRVFGHLVTLAAPVVQHYHSDLYQDAGWIKQHVTGPCEMDFVVRTYGTHLGMVGSDRSMAAAYLNSPSMQEENARGYRLALTVDERREWWLTTTRVL